MNKMNLPPPFDKPTHEPQTVIEEFKDKISFKEPDELVQIDRLSNKDNSSESESELEDDDFESTNNRIAANNIIKRKKIQKIQPQISKKRKLELVKKSDSLTTHKENEPLAIKEVFDLNIHTNKKLELNLPSTVMTNEKNDKTSENPVSDFGFGIIEANKTSSDPSNILEEWKTASSRFLSDKELEENKVSKSGIYLNNFI